MKKETLTANVEIPGGVTVQAANGEVKVRGAKGEIMRKWQQPFISIRSENNKVTIESARATGREKKMVNTIQSHITNMVHGAQNGHCYRLKICSGHFPMTVAVAGNEFAVKNFLGEKYPRTLKLPPSVKVSVQGQEVVVEGAALEEVSQCAANIEKLTMVKNRDRRIFQDGIYITEKDGQTVK